MKLILQSKKDVNDLTGKWIIQVNSDEPDYTINEKNWDFVKEKRLSLVVGLRLQGLYYEHGNFESWEKFAKIFNGYIFDKSPESNGTRFHRLLTSSEIDFICKKFKENN